MDQEIINSLSLAASIGLVVVAFDIFSLALFHLLKKRGFSSGSIWKPR